MSSQRADLLPTARTCIYAVAVQEPLAVRKQSYYYAVIECIHATRASATRHLDTYYLSAGRFVIEAVTIDYCTILWTRNPEWKTYQASYIIFLVITMVVSDRIRDTCTV